MVGKSRIFIFKTLGVVITIEANRNSLLNKIKNAMPNILPVKWVELETARTVHKFEVRLTGNLRTGKFSAKINEEQIVEDTDFARGMDLLISRIRLTVAEFARGIVFLHAGAVGWNGKTIIIPGRSFAGKTTLVAEFAKNGCEYFSDEYALIDKKGEVRPFLKKLSMRGIVDDYTQVDLPIEEYGGKSARQHLAIGCVLIAEYKKTKKSQPKIREVSLGEGIMACIANSISIRQNPKFVIETLNSALANAVVLKATRGEAAKFVEKFFGYFERRNRQTD